MAQKKALIFSLFFLFQSWSHASPQTFGPLSLQLPEGWACQTDAQTLICLDRSPSSQQNAALVVSYKRRGGEDSLTIYKDQLSRPRHLSQGEVNSPSQPKGVREMTINRAKWIEGIHFGSEINGYYTHYYATVAGPYAILVSISVQDEAYEKMIEFFKPTVNSFLLNIPQTLDDTRAQNQAHTTEHSGSLFDFKSGRPQMQIMGYSVRKTYIYVGGALLVALGLLAYALFMD